MTRHTRRARIGELTEELSVGAAMQLRCESTSIRPIVQAVVDYLVSQYPSQDLYIPASLQPPTYPIAQIKSELASGKSIRTICKRYRLSHKMLYRLLAEDG